MSLPIATAFIQDVCIQQGNSISNEKGHVENKNVIKNLELILSKIKYFRKTITEELMAIIWHPKNIGRFETLGI